MVDIQTFSYRDLTVDIRSDDRFFTVYNKEDQTPMGTVIRPRVYSKGEAWTVYNIQGELVHSSMGGNINILLAKLNKAIEAHREAVLREMMKALSI